MNIMKTNMLSIDNKIKREEAVNTAVQASVPSKVQSNAGMRALMFQGMQNLMANPMLAKQTGVMNDEPKADETAKSYVAPYSSNIAFQGAASKTMKAAAFAALIAMASGLTSCYKNEQIQIVDLKPVVEAIDALRADMKEYNTQQQQAMQKAINALLQIQTSIQNQTFTIESFRDMVEGYEKNGVFQRSQLLDAIMTLQNINEDAARAIVNTILLAYENHQITFDQAMAQIQDLLKTNNSLLSELLSEVKAAKASADKNAQALLQLVQAGNKDRQKILEQTKVLIAQNDILIDEGFELINKADQLNMSVEELTIIAQYIGESLEDVMKMSKDEIIAAIKEQTTEIQTNNGKLDDIADKLGNNNITVEQAAEDIKAILGGIKETLDGFVADWTAKSDALLAGIANLNKLAAKMYKEQKFQSGMLIELTRGMHDLEMQARAENAALKAIYDKIQNNGGGLTAQEMETIMKRLNGNLQASLGEIAGLIKAELAKDDKQIALLASVNEKLDNLGTVSGDILLEIQDMGDDLSALDSIDSKLDSLLTVVKNFAKSFENYAKDAMDAHGQEIALLNNIKAEFPNVNEKLQTLINQGKKAEIQRNNIATYLESLDKTAKRIEEKLGHVPTVAEFEKWNADNRKYYGDLIKAAGVDPAEFETIKDLLKAINTNLVDFQGETNGLLADILARIKAMDTTAPDYTAKLDTIIEKMKDFKFECNCKCDCDTNHNIHEGIIGVLS